MLEFNPNKRISSKDCLKHKFFADILDENDIEKGSDNKFTYRFDPDMKDFGEDKDFIKKLIYNEIVDWNKKFNNFAGDAIISKIINQNL
jgi:serine/threonine protein kinase